MTRIPSATPTRLSPDERVGIRAAIDRVVAGDQWILGPEVSACEQELARYVGAGDVVGVGNGTDALAVAFTALGLPAGSEVLVTATDGGYSATAARMVGLTPVVMDVDANSLDPSVDAAAMAVTANTSAIVVTHLHGNALELGAIDRWRTALGLALIEDCAQAHGLRVDGSHVGGVGDAATFSFYPTKNLGAIGDGGAVAFPHASASGTADRARALRQYGWSERYLPSLPNARNTRLDAIQAAILRARLPFLDARNARRQEIHSRYQQALASGGRARLLGVAGATVAHHAVVLTETPEEREDLRLRLETSGIDTAVHYPWLVSEMPGLELASTGPFPIASSRRDRILSIPCTPELRDDEVDRVTSALLEWTSR